MMTLYLHDRYKEALEVFKEGLKVSDGHIIVTAQTSKQLITFALMLEAIGFIDLGHQFLNARVQNTPKFARGWLELAAFYIRHNKPDIAQQVLEKAAQNCGYGDLDDAMHVVSADIMEKSVLLMIKLKALESLDKKGVTLIERTEFEDRIREENRLMVPAFQIDKKTIKEITKKKKGRFR
jgi:hypothetical protein